MGRERATCHIECIRPLESLLRKKGNEVAAVILEPLILAAGGMIAYPKEYLLMADRLTKKYNVHLILDEVATGFGRTGKMFACEHVGIKPDFMCLSKGITAGFLPLGATLTTEKVYNAFYGGYKERKTFYHGHTYTANPISCAAALASLDVFNREKTLKKVERLIPVFHDGLERFRHLKVLGDVRYIGMIGALELVKNKKTKRPFGIGDRVGMRVYTEGLKENIILRPLGNIVYFYLPLSISEKEIETILEKAYAIIQRIA